MEKNKSAGLEHQIELFEAPVGAWKENTEGGIKIKMLTETCVDNRKSPPTFSRLVEDEAGNKYVLAFRSGYHGGITDAENETYAGVADISCPKCHTGEAKQIAHQGHWIVGYCRKCAHTWIIKDFGKLG